MSKLEGFFDDNGPYFLGFEYYQMPDLYIFPLISRLYYTENSLLHKEIWSKINPRKRYPKISKWFDAMISHPHFSGNEANTQIVKYNKDQDKIETIVLNPIIPSEYFHLWIEELVET